MNNSNLSIFSGNSNPQLSEEICQIIGKRLGDATVTIFPDGESFVKINENVRGQDVFILQSTCPPTNHHFMETYDFLKGLNVSYLHVFPYSERANTTAKKMTEKVGQKISRNCPTNFHPRFNILR